MDPQLIELEPHQYWSLQHWCQHHDCPLDSDGTTKIYLDNLGRQYIDDSNIYCPKFSEEEEAKRKELGLEESTYQHESPQEIAYDCWYEEASQACSESWTVKPVIVGEREDAIRNESDAFSEDHPLNGMFGRSEGEA